MSAKIGMRRNVHGKGVVKVAFTGGPCAGKSTCIERVKKLIDTEYGDEWNCYTVAEAASTMYSTGRVSRADLLGERLKRWQRDIVECSMTFEGVFDNIASDEPKKHTLILCDRGAIDPKVFTPPHMWKEILHDMQTSESTLIGRYDLVMILHTAPDVNYHCENNRARRETPEQARVIDHKYALIYESHPRAVEIEANREHGMEEKFGAVWEQIRELIESD